ncbi:hypothetical protein C5167_006281 [Papaver somniferum]|uniref:Uncharacterized protein n=1 Tax=Papaver somniferum TaxID=3469 RepID=A0A4Y7JEN2_PAPSO|nr:hypothetical protein C5167_006281 [Papaver somniferum]
MLPFWDQVESREAVNDVSGTTTVAVSGTISSKVSDIKVESGTEITDTGITDNSCGTGTARLRSFSPMALKFAENQRCSGSPFIPTHHLHFLSAFLEVESEKRRDCLANLARLVAALFS